MGQESSQTQSHSGLSNEPIYTVAGSAGNDGPRPSSTPQEPDENLDETVGIFEDILFGLLLYGIYSRTDR